MSRWRFRFLGVLIGALLTVGMVAGPAAAATVSTSSPQSVSSVPADGGWGNGGWGHGGWGHHGGWHHGGWGHRHHHCWWRYGHRYCNWW